MDVLSKIVTALKGGINEAGEAIVDRQALRILDQEIREAIEELNQTKDSLASMIARQKLSEEKAATLQAAIAENETYALKALEKGDEALAMDVASKVAELENQLADENAVTDEFKQNANQLRNVIAKAEKDVKYMKAQLDTVRATENVQRAEAAICERHGGTNSKLRTAMESLERIKEKQALKGAQINAARPRAFEDDESSLEQRLEQAGIKKTNKASDVLERLKQT